MLVSSIKAEKFPIFHIKKKKSKFITKQLPLQKQKYNLSFGLKKGEIEGRSLVKTTNSGIKETNKNTQNFKIAEILNEFFDEDIKSDSPIIKCVKPDFISRFSERISDNPQKNILIGISGESASGKTTICKTLENLSQELNMPIELLSADNYFNDISALIAKYGSFDKLLEAGYDVDSPNNFYMDRLHDDLEKLSQGKDVKIPQYLVNGTGISIPNAIPKKAERVIVVEGMATMYSPVRELLDAQIYVDVTPEVQEKRYISRAQISRNQTEEDAKKQLDYVREAAKKYILPKKDNSDIIIDGCISKEQYATSIAKIFNRF